MNIVDPGTCAVCGRDLSTGWLEVEVWESPKPDYSDGAWLEAIYCSQEHMVEALSRRPLDWHVSSAQDERTGIRWRNIGGTAGIAALIVLGPMVWLYGVIELVRRLT